MFNAIPALAWVPQGVPTVVVRPTADVTDGAWLNEAASATNLYASLDEATASDTDYIESSLAASTDLCELAFGDPGGTPKAGTVTLTLRYGRA